MTKIIKIEIKNDKNGTPMKVAQLEGNKTVYVNSNYDKDLYPLMEEGKDVEVIQVDKFWKIMPESLGLKPKQDYKGNQITRNMDKKETSINNFQEAKEKNMIMMSANRDATLIMVERMKTFYTMYSKQMSEEEFNKQWKDLRQWFHSQYTTPFV